MVIDTSAIVAILLQKPEARRIGEKIEQDPIRLMSAVNWLECKMVLTSRLGAPGASLVDTLFQEIRIRIVPVDTVHVQTALSAWEQYGKGRHSAGLNLGDCCAYATTVLSHQKLLCKGNDFQATDVARVEY